LMMMAISGLVLNKNTLSWTQNTFTSRIPYWWISCPTRNVLLLSRWKNTHEDNWLKSTLIYALLLGSILRHQSRSGLWPVGISVVYLKVLKKRWRNMGGRDYIRSFDRKVDTILGTT
jgi:hypothetical protein